jgi:hemerythrin-like domain-containing protein
MVEIIEVLRQEHRNIEKLLHVLERELSVFDRGDRPDYEVVLAVIEYFKDYPDTCHHPKEDIIVAKLKAHDPVAAAAIGDLEAEHREGARRLRQVAQAVECVLSDQGLLRQTIDDIIFQAALDALLLEYWSDIAMHLAERYGTASEPDFEEKFSTLRRNILDMEEQAETERPH